MLEGRGSVRGTEAIAAQGVEPAAVNGYLSARSTKLDNSVLEVVDAFRPLLVGHLSGQADPCLRAPAFGYLRPCTLRQAGLAPRP